MIAVSIVFVSSGDDSLGSPHVTSRWMTHFCRTFTTSAKCCCTISTEKCTGTKLEFLCHFWCLYVFSITSVMQKIKISHGILILGKKTSQGAIWDIARISDGYGIWCLIPGEHHPKRPIRDGGLIDWDWFNVYETHLVLDSQYVKSSNSFGCKLHAKPLLGNIAILSHSQPWVLDFMSQMAFWGSTHTHRVLQHSRTFTSPETTFLGSNKFDGTELFMTEMSMVYSH